MTVLHLGAGGVAFEIPFVLFFWRWWICCCGSEVDLGGGLGCDWVDAALRWVGLAHLMLSVCLYM